MGLNEEQMELVDRSDMDHDAYIMILFSLAFMIFMFVNMLINVYDCAGNPAVSSEEPSEGRLGTLLHGTPLIRDAQEFELAGLMSDDEDAPRKSRGRESMDSSSSGEDKDRNGNAQR